MRRIIMGVAGLMLSAAPSMAAPVAKSDALYSEMLALDGEIFERGFNHCELAGYTDVIAADLEFYHDVGGPTYGRDAFTSDMQTGICQSEWHPRRELVSNSFSVFPLRRNGELYGALVNGEHLFYQTPPDGAEHLTGRASFSMFWIKEDGKWLLKRVFSYDHGSASAND